MSQAPHSLRPVVAVDLDGTLLRTDLSWELLIAYLRSAPWGIVSILAWMCRGGLVRLKMELAARVEVEGAGLPWNIEVLSWCEARASSGVRVVLATASPLKSAREATAHFPFISQVLGSDSEHNLKAEKKAGKLVQLYGSGNFDYVGNSSADVPVWRVAREAFFVGNKAALSRYSSQLAGKALLKISGANYDKARRFADALRPHQWLKNLLLLAPLLAAHRWSDPDCWRRILPMLLAVCCVASAAYLVNDLADLDADRRHPRKKHRPFASGDMQIPTGIMAVAALVILGLGLAWSSGSAAVAATLGYLGFSLTYSLYLKRFPFADVVWLSGMYCYRVMIGGVISGVMVSSWLLAFATSLFLGLAFMKRYIELIAVTPKHAERLPGRGYAGGDARLMGTAGVGASLASVVVLGFYLGSPTSRVLYARPAWLWLVVLAIAVWLARIWIMSAWKMMDDDPVWFAAKDRATWLLASVCVVSIVLAGPLK